MLALLALACLSSAPEPAPSDAWRCDRDKPRSDCFSRVPGGTLLLGAQANDPGGPGYDPDATPQEGPPRRAVVAPFWLQRTEATVGSWRACVRAGACDPARVLQGDGFALAYPPSAPDDRKRDAMPVNGLSWHGAASLCAFLGGRLPTEAEWELAARGTDGRRWPWGDRPECPSIPRDDAFGFLHDGGETASCALDGPRPFDDVPAESPYGMVAMAGNLWEWTRDPWGDEGARAQRGGSWMSAAPAEVRATVRGGMAPDARLPDVGARCAVGR